MRKSSYSEQGEKTTKRNSLRKVVEWVFFGKSLKSSSFQVSSSLVTSTAQRFPVTGVTFTVPFLYSLVVGGGATMSQ